MGRDAAVDSEDEFLTGSLKPFQTEVSCLESSRECREAKAKAESKRSRKNICYRKDMCSRELQ